MKQIFIGLLMLMSLTALASNKSSLYLEIESLSINCQSNDRICKGDLVLHDDSIREVELVDNTGRVVLKEDSRFYRTFTRASDISKVVPSYGGYKAGIMVLDDDSIREVELVDNTGRVVLKEDSRFYRTFTRASDISKVVSSYRGFKSGDRVLYRDSIRVIELVDNTGRVVLKEDSNDYRTFTNRRNITMVEECL